MSTKNKTDLKADFQTGSDITQEKFEHLIDSSVNKVDDLSIDTNGNVGIGTTNPEAKLHIVNDNDPPENIPFQALLKLGANQNKESGKDVFDESKPSYGIEFYRHWNSDSRGFKPQGGIYAWGGSVYSSGLAFRTAQSAEQLNTNMVITGEGNVGIGTTSPSEKLEVSGNMKVTHIVQEDWQDLTLANGWARYNTTYNPPQYFKDSQGIVHLRGLIKNGTAAGISTLPTGYRPLFRELHIGSTNSNASCRIDITKAGVITLIDNYSALWVSLDGITFRTV